MLHSCHLSQWCDIERWGLTSPMDFVVWLRCAAFVFSSQNNGRNVFELKIQSTQRTCRKKSPMFISFVVLINCSKLQWKHNGIYGGTFSCVMIVSDYAYCCCGHQPTRTVGPAVFDQILVGFSPQVLFHHDFFIISVKNNLPDIKASSGVIVF